MNGGGTVLAIVRAPALFALSVRFCWRAPAREMENSRANVTTFEKFYLFESSLSLFLSLCVLILK